MTIKTAGAFKLYLFAAWFMLGTSTSNAQYVTIPDSGFANWMINSGLGSCMHTDSIYQLDTTCIYLPNIHSIDVSYMHIGSLEGLQYFKNLDSLKCNSDTVLTYLPSLPVNLRILECRNGGLTSLPALPDSLTRLFCEFNDIDSLPALPPTLQTITCYNNNLTSLPALPAALTSLYCSGNKLDSLPALPAGLIVLSCYGNKLGKLPTLPSGLVDLSCSQNQITALPALPSKLTDLDCYLNKLTSLPALPDSLQQLTCSYNQLTALPALPNTLTLINAEHNNLTSLPALPDSLFQLFIDNNPNLQCLPLLNTIVDFEFFTTGIVCLPNAGNIYTSVPDTLNLCDSTNNPYGCLETSGVNQIVKPRLGIYPNPADDYFMLVTNQSSTGGMLKVYDMEGKLKAAFKITSVNQRISTRDLEPATYLVMLTDTYGHSAVSKLIVQ